MFSKRKLLNGLTIIILILLANLVACVMGPTKPGYIHESVSNVDNTKEISIESAWLFNCPIKLSLFKNSKMQSEEIYLTAVVKGAHNFGKRESLRFNVDGQVFGFISMDEITEINTTRGFYGSGHYVPPSNWSSKRYIVTKQFIKRLIDAEEVWVQVILSKTYVEGEFSVDGSTMLARPAFRKFYSKLDQL